MPPRVLTSAVLPRQRGGAVLTAGPAPSGGRGRGPWTTALAPALLALGLGLWGLTRQGSMWRDESVTYQVAHRGTRQIGALLGQVDAVHGVYYLLMHALFRVWDGGLVALRLPSVVATAAAAALVALTGRRLAGHRTGLAAGAVFALAPLVQMYAQEGRSYASVAALVALATYLLVRGLDGGGRWVWAGYAGAAAAAGWLHEFAVPALVAHGITVLTGGVPRAVRRRWAFAAGAAVLLVAPLAVFSMGQSDQVSWIGGPSAVQWADIVAVTALGTGCAYALSRTEGPGARATGRPVSPARLGLPLLIAPTALLLAAAVYRPMYVDRYVLYSYAGLALLLGQALDRLLAYRPVRGTARSRRWKRYGIRAGVALAVLSLLPVSLEMRTPDSRKDDVAAVARTVRSLADQDGADSVLFMPARRREWRMSYPGAYRGLRDLALRRDPVRSRTLEGVELPSKAIRQHVLGARRIGALTDPPDQPLDAVPQEAVKREALRRFFVECARVPVKGAQVVLYAHRGDCPSGLPHTGPGPLSGPGRAGPAHGGVGEPGGTVRARTEP
ncbi:glycosyltransferase family 39 protein [Streptomyces sp. 8L]|uniref:glycosyltransferase family 39 protein n=1 Tax=Streptomyces sp. 8L TaxID=2877242 RepID=UPI001CD7250C|nr:glycosyltransferase family 39 protein [Streptomyces sp. 8L]MCA1218285.1 glycosyltransferase family 39 protein [Streptomyces sp. 8L]